MLNIIKKESETAELSDDGKFADERYDILPDVREGNMNENSETIFRLRNPVVGSKDNEHGLPVSVQLDKDIYYYYDSGADYPAVQSNPSNFYEYAYPMLEEDKIENLKIDQPALVIPEESVIRSGVGFVGPRSQDTIRMRVEKRRRPIPRAGLASTIGPRLRNPPFPLSEHPIQKMITSTVEPKKVEDRDFDETFRYEVPNRRQGLFEDDYEIEVDAGNKDTTMSAFDRAHIRTTKLTTPVTTDADIPSSTKPPLDTRTQTLSDESSLSDSDDPLSKHLLTRKEIESLLLDLLALSSSPEELSETLDTFKRERMGLTDSDDAVFPVTQQSPSGENIFVMPEGGFHSEFPNESSEMMAGGDERKDSHHQDFTSDSIPTVNEQENIIPTKDQLPTTIAPTAPILSDNSNIYVQEEAIKYPSLEELLQLQYEQQLLLKERLNIEKDANKISTTSDRFSEDHQIDVKNTQTSVSPDEKLVTFHHIKTNDEKLVTFHDLESLSREGGYSPSYNSHSQGQKEKRPQIKFVNNEEVTKPETIFINNRETSRDELHSEVDNSAKSSHTESYQEPIKDSHQIVEVSEKLMTDSDPANVYPLLNSLGIHTPDQLLSALQKGMFAVGPNEVSIGESSADSDSTTYGVSSINNKIKDSNFESQLDIEINENKPQTTDYDTQIFSDESVHYQTPVKGEILESFNSKNSPEASNKIQNGTQDEEMSQDNFSHLMASFTSGEEMPIITNIQSLPNEPGALDAFINSQKNFGPDTQIIAFQDPDNPDRIIAFQTKSEAIPSESDVEANGISEVNESDLFEPYYDNNENVLLNEGEPQSGGTVTLPQESSLQFNTDLIQQSFPAGLGFDRNINSHEKLIQQLEQRRRHQLLEELRVKNSNVNNYSPTQPSSSDVFLPGNLFSHVKPVPLDPNRPLSPNNMHLLPPSTPHPRPLNTQPSTTTKKLTIWDFLTTRKPLILDTDIVTSMSSNLEIEHRGTTRKHIGPVYLPENGTTPSSEVESSHYGLLTVPVITGDHVEFVTVNKSRMNYPKVVIVNTSPTEKPLVSTTPMSPEVDYSEGRNDNNAANSFSLSTEHLDKLVRTLIGVDNSRSYNSDPVWEQSVPTHDLIRPKAGFADEVSNTVIKNSSISSPGIELLYSMDIESDPVETGSLFNLNTRPLVMPSELVISDDLSHVNPETVHTTIEKHISARYDSLIPENGMPGFDVVDRDYSQGVTLNKEELRPIHDVVRDLSEIYASQPDLVEQLQSFHKSKTRSEERKKKSLEIFDANAYVNELFADNATSDKGAVEKEDNFFYFDPESSNVANQDYSYLEASDVPSDNNAMDYPKIENSSNDHNTFQENQQTVTPLKSNIVNHDYSASGEPQVSADSSYVVHDDTKSSPDSFVIINREDHSHDYNIHVKANDSSSKVENIVHVLPKIDLKFNSLPNDTNYQSSSNNSSLEYLEKMDGVIADAGAPFGYQGEVGGKIAKPKDYLSQSSELNDTDSNPYTNYPINDNINFDSGAPETNMLKSNSANFTTDDSQKNTSNFDESFTEPEPSSFGMGAPINFNSHLSELSTEGTGIEDKLSQNSDYFDNNGAYINYGSEKLLTDRNLSQINERSDYVDYSESNYYYDAYNDPYYYSDYGIDSNLTTTDIDYYYPSNEQASNYSDQNILFKNVSLDPQMIVDLIEQNPNLFLDDYGTQASLADNYDAIPIMSETISSYYDDIDNHQAPTTTPAPQLDPVTENTEFATTLPPVEELENDPISEKEALDIQYNDTLTKILKLEQQITHSLGPTAINFDKQELLRILDEKYLARTPRRKRRAAAPMRSAINPFSVYRYNRRNFYSGRQRQRNNFKVNHGLTNRKIYSSRPYLNTKFNRFPGSSRPEHPKHYTFKYQKTDPGDLRKEDPVTVYVTTEDFMKSSSKKKENREFLSRSYGVSSDSPVYTFVLKQGQSLHELLQEIFKKLIEDERKEQNKTQEETFLQQSHSESIFTTTERATTRNKLRPTLSGDKLLQYTTEGNSFKDTSTVPSVDTNKKQSKDILFMAPSVTPTNSETQDDASNLKDISNPNASDITEAVNRIVLDHLNRTKIGTLITDQTQFDAQLPPFPQVYKEFRYTTKAPSSLNNSTTSSLQDVESTTTSSTTPPTQPVDSISLLPTASNSESLVNYTHKPTLTREEFFELYSGLYLSTTTESVKKDTSNLEHFELFPVKTRPMNRLNLTLASVDSSSSIEPHYTVIQNADLQSGDSQIPGGSSEDLKENDSSTETDNLYPTTEIYDSLTEATAQSTNSQMKVVTSVDMSVRMHNEKIIPANVTKGKKKNKIFSGYYLTYTVYENK